MAALSSMFGNWSNTWTTIGTTTSYPLTYTLPNVGYIEPPTPAKRSALDWLDAAIEEVCSLARDVALA